MERSSSGLIVWFLWMTLIIFVGVLKYKGINALRFLLVADAGLACFAAGLVLRKLKKLGNQVLWNGAMDIDLGLSLATTVVACLTAITLTVRLWP